MRRSKWGVRLRRCLALPELLPQELPLVQAAGLYQMIGRIAPDGASQVADSIQL